MLTLDGVAFDLEGDRGVTAGDFFIGDKVTCRSSSLSSTLRAFDGDGLGRPGLGVGDSRFRLAGEFAAENMARMPSFLCEMGSMNVFDSFPTFPTSFGTW